MSPVRSKRGRALFAAATLAVLAELAAGAFAIRSTNAESKAAAAAGEAAPQALPVPVAVIEEREVVTWDEFSGRLEAPQRIAMRQAACNLQASFAVFQQIRPKAASHRACKRVAEVDAV